MSTFLVTASGIEVGYTDTEAAGAIHSLRWNGMQFLDANDDGRLLQAAISCDGMGEAFNPTEGGSAQSASFVLPSLSKLVQHARGANFLETCTHMAYWVPVGDDVVLSNHWLHKRVTINPGWLDWNVEFHTPEGEAHTQLQMELVTGYMPSAFSRFFTVDRNESAVRALSDTPGEQPAPVIFSTPDGQHAMGVYLPAWGDAAPPLCGYGRWRSPQGADVVKWNAVARVSNPKAGNVFAYRAILSVGTLADCMRQVNTLRGVYAGQTRRLYWAALNRAPDPGGYAYYIAQLQSNVSLVTIARNFMASPEGQAIYGGTTDAQFVAVLYQHVLGRVPASDELAYQVGAVATYGRPQVLVNFSESPENQTRRLLAEA